MSDILQRAQFRLSYGECDPVGIVYYAAYYPWMERLHTEWVIRTGLTQDENRARWGITTVCRASSCEYLDPGVLFDELTMDMTLGRIGVSSYSMDFNVVRATGGTVARGKMTLVCVSEDGGPTPIPPDYLDRIKQSMIQSDELASVLYARQPV